MILKFRNKETGEEDTDINLCVGKYGDVFSYNDHSETVISKPDIEAYLETSFGQHTIYYIINGRK